MQKRKERKKQRNPWKKIKRREGENLFSEKDEEEAKTSSRALPNRQKNKQITYVDVWGCELDRRVESKWSPQR